MQTEVLIYLWRCVIASSLEESFSPSSPKTVSLKLSSLKFNTNKATPKTTPKTLTSQLIPVSIKLNNIKSTRSKAWLDEYLTSDDPIKLYLASVYTYHDSSGEYVAQPFLELPSRKVREGGEE